MRLLEKIRWRGRGRDLPNQPPGIVSPTPGASDIFRQEQDLPAYIGYLQEVVAEAREQVLFDENNRPYLPRNIRNLVISEVVINGGVQVLKKCGVEGLKQAAMTVISAQDPRGEMYLEWHRHARRQHD